jgi:hypothetical protein
VPGTVLFRRTGAVQRPDGSGQRPDGSGQRPDGSGQRPDGSGQRPDGARRPVNAGLLALSLLPDARRRQLLRAWVDCGDSTDSSVLPEVDSLLDFIAAQLPDPSPALSVCRVEQLTLRANRRSRDFRVPDTARLTPQCRLRRGGDAGAVRFEGAAAGVLRRLLPDGRLPPGSQPPTLLVAPGLAPRVREASLPELALWERLAAPASVDVLQRAGNARETIETLLRAGVLEYA